MCVLQFHMSLDVDSAELFSQKEAKDRETHEEEKAGQETGRDQ